VVDQDRGIILTNRHITGVGPMRATATFDRHEELEVEVLYRDPVHDFGFFQYDPAQLRLTRCAEISLDPQGLRVGTEVRVIGNDAGEKLQILSGTIARVDRNVPEFHTIYNDENTFYAGAGASTSGGSSGSPVLNKAGKAIALNAAGQEGTASAFFLPLDRVKYALELIRSKKPVPRGTCFASFLFKPFDDLLRLGLATKHEREVRKNIADSTGLLIVDSVLTEQQVLKAGDILLKLEDKVCGAFVDLESVLDGKVGEEVQMTICRNKEELTLKVPIMDWHELIPRKCVELGLDTLHSIGYHAARKAKLPLATGMFLSKVGYVFGSLGCSRASVITSINGKPVPDAEALVKALQGIAHRQYFQVTWYEMSQFARDRTLKSGFAKMSRAWFPLRLWSCKGGIADATTERWEAKDVPVPEEPPASADPVSDAGDLQGGDRLITKMSPSLVSVRFRTDRRFCMEASPSGVAEGVGVLVDEEQGLILTDRHSVPQSLGDVEVTLAGSATVDAEVVFIHPLHNLAVIKCDQQAYRVLMNGPEHSGTAKNTQQKQKRKGPVKAVTLATGDKAELKPGQSVHFVGYDNQGNVFSSRVTVAACYLPSGRDEFPLWDVPRFRERNMNIVVLSDTPEDARGGVLCDSDGRVRALFAAFDMQDPDRDESTEAYGITANLFGPMIQRLKNEADTPMQVCSLDLEVTAIELATLKRGAPGKLPQEWERTVKKRSSRLGQIPRALRVHRLRPLGASEGVLHSGDILLKVGNTFITCSMDIEYALDAWLERLKRCSDGEERSSTKRPFAETEAQAKGKAKAKAKAKARGKAKARSKSKAHAPNKRPAASTGGEQAGEASNAEEAGRLSITVFRNGAEHEVHVTPNILGSDEEQRILLWAGLVLRDAPSCLLDRCSGAATAVLAKMRPARGVLIQHVLGGSPADTREIPRLTFLLEVNGAPVKDLGEVLEAVSAATHSTPSAKTDGSCGGSGRQRQFIRLRLMDTHGGEHVRALQPDLVFFPTFDLTRESGRWECHRRDHC